MSYRDFLNGLEQEEFWSQFNTGLDQGLTRIGNLFGGEMPVPTRPGAAGLLGRAGRFLGEQSPAIAAELGATALAGPAGLGAVGTGLASGAVGGTVGAISAGDNPLTQGALAAGIGAALPIAGFALRGAGRAAPQLAAQAAEEVPVQSLIQQLPGSTTTAFGLGPPMTVDESLLMRSARSLFAPVVPEATLGPTTAGAVGQVAEVVSTPFEPAAQTRYPPIVKELIDDLADSLRTGKPPKRALEPSPELREIAEKQLAQREALAQSVDLALGPGAAAATRARFKVASPTNEVMEMIQNATDTLPDIC